jgi:hypothetical protein
MHAREIFAAVAHAIEASLETWQNQTRVTNVVARGRVPTPPGPVVDGRASMDAGGLA